ncbi:LuxR C-terminal-related transcriptional regulator [Gordonia sp. NPDC003504]
MTSNRGQLTVAVAAEGDITDTALCAYVERLGFTAVLVHADAPVTAAPDPAAAIDVVLVRSTQQVDAVRQHSWLLDAALIGIGIRIGDPRGIDVADTGRSAPLIAGFLADLAENRQPRTGAIRMTERERQILTTYALGATMSTTAATHHIAESTVREHYRRVVQRYNDAGRPIGNKAQLLLRLMADGWVQPREILSAAG